MDLVAVFPEGPPATSRDKAHESADHDAYVDLPDDEMVVEVYRFNEQKVFGIAVDNDDRKIHILDVTWRADGVILAVATSDNVTRLVNCFSGKVVHTLSDNVRSDQGINNTITMLAYTSQFIQPDLVRSQLATISSKTSLTLDDLLGLDSDYDGMLQLGTELPSELARLDTEVYLPRLSTLPSSGAFAGDVFSSRTSIDAIFHNTRKDAQASYIDVLLTPRSNGTVKIRIIDSFEIGDVDLNSTIGLPRGCRMLRVASVVCHPLSEKVFVVAEGEASRTSDDTSLHVISLDFRFIQRLSQTLPTLAAKATQLHQLTRYLIQIQTTLTRQVKEAFDLPARFLRVLNEDLVQQDGEGSNFHTAAYHSILTGEVSGKYKEWLVDQMVARNVERWRKAVSECLELTRNLMLDSWIPAVERASIVVSKVRSLTLADSTFGIELQLLDQLRNTIDIMAVVGEDMLRQVSIEITDFHSFLRWFRMEAEAAALEETSEKLEEMRDGNDQIEVRRVLRYIASGVHVTLIKPYLDTGTTPQSDVSEDKAGLYQAFKDSKAKSREPSARFSLPVLTKALQAQCDQLFEQVVLKLQDEILPEYVCHVPDEMNLDTKMICGAVIDKHSANEPHDRSSLVLVSRDKHHHNVVASCSIDATAGPRQRPAKTSHTFDADTSILDVKFGHSDELMILTSQAKHWQIDSTTIPSFADLTTKHKFGASDKLVQAGFSPASMNVNGRKKRRTVAVVDELGRGYAVYDLDSHHQAESPT